MVVDKLEYYKRREAYSSFQSFQTMKSLPSFASLAISIALSGSALGQSPIWGQCGGIGWCKLLEII
ncbi:hypothetical protein BDP27DRAFT_1318917 [Rhodocollybia butyracea]|uniref:Uncharacterized protein n=1 Tax=Rhodocollybia butyracea TaxID=206335 RepID=A0A9P5Q0V4_9AGAR|nr:hypothetical protein BDP27DRAFT_1318917 [Rhodocollybia butyracea]